MTHTEVILISIDILLQERSKNNRLESEINKRKSDIQHNDDLHNH